MKNNRKPYPDNLIREIMKRDIIICSHQRDGLEKALNALTDEQRRILLMRYDDGMTYRQIADITDCDISKVKVVIARSLRILRKRENRALMEDKELLNV